MTLFEAICFEGTSSATASRNPPRTLSAAPRSPRRMARIAMSNPARLSALALVCLLHAPAVLAFGFGVSPALRPALRSSSTIPAPALRTPLALGSTRSRLAFSPAVSAFPHLAAQTCCQSGRKLTELSILAGKLEDERGRGARRRRAAGGKFSEGKGRGDARACAAWRLVCMREREEGWEVKGVRMDGGCAGGGARPGEREER